MNLTWGAYEHPNLAQKYPLGRKKCTSSRQFFEDKSKEKRVNLLKLRPIFPAA
jgi:hypothetical protein